MINNMSYSCYYYWCYQFRPRNLRIWVNMRKICGSWSQAHRFGRNHSLECWPIRGYFTLTRASDIYIYIYIIYTSSTCENKCGINTFICHPCFIQKILVIQFGTSNISPTVLQGFREPTSPEALAFAVEVPWCPHAGHEDDGHDQ